MSSVTVSTTIRQPRERVFDFLDDLARHEAFTDHFLVDWTLTRERSTGVGAGARMRAKAGGRHPWITITVVESVRPERTVEEGRGGKDGRRRTRGIYRLPAAPGAPPRGSPPPPRPPAPRGFSSQNGFAPAAGAGRLRPPFPRRYLRRQNT